MIPILYEKNETSFTSNGLGRLDELTECVVTEERNGEFVLTAKILTTARMYPKILKDRIIFAKAHDGDDGQPFRIEKISTPLGNAVEIEANHISYQLSWIPLIPFTATSCADCFSKIPQKSMTTNPFAFWTDKQVTANFTLDAPASVRSILGGIQGSVLDIYGGEYEFDKYTVKLHQSRGADLGVALRYGKNITDIKQEESIESTYTGIVPYYQDEENLVTVDGYIVNSQYASLYSFNRVKVVDFSSDYESPPTTAQLLAKAQSYITANNIGVPTVSIDVSFVALWQTEEYKNIANLERVHLCDTVTVIFEKLGISAKAKVVKTEFNVLLERYNKITIGSVNASLAKTIADMGDEMTQQFDEQKSAYQKAIANATAQITGAKGGVVQLHYNADDQPTELTIANNVDINQATKVWRWNIGGLGYSSTGYNGTYTTAITQDGAIVADFITTGTLDANLLKAGIIKNKNNNNSYWNLETGEFKTTDGTFLNAHVKTSGANNRYLDLENAILSGGVSNTEYGVISFADTVNNIPALGIRGDKIIIKGQLYTNADKSSGTVYSGRSTTISNIVSGLNITTGRYTKVVNNLDIEWAAWEDIVGDLKINWNTQTASWTNYSFEIPDAFNWMNASFYALESAPTWTNNTLQFVNGILV